MADRQNVDFVEFLNIAKNSETYAEVASKTGLKVGSVKARISKYRKLYQEANKEFPIQLSGEGRGRTAITIDDIDAVLSSDTELDG